MNIKIAIGSIIFASFAAISSYLISNNHHGLKTETQTISTDNQPQIENTDSASDNSETPKTKTVAGDIVITTKPGKDDVHLPTNTLSIGGQVVYDQDMEEMSISKVFHFRIGPSS